MELSSLEEDATQVLRKRKVEEFCKNFKNNQSKYFPEIVLVTDPEEKLAYCHVPKVASSAWMLVFAELNQNKLRDQVSALNKSSDHVFEELLESGQLHEIMLKNFSIKFSENKSSSAKQESFKFLFLRHPFERLVRPLALFFARFDFIFRKISNTMKLG